MITATAHTGSVPPRGGRRWLGVAALPVLLVLLGACATDTGSWTKSGVETAARDADLLACQTQTNRETVEAALNPTFYRTARYTYREPRYGLFGPSAVDDDSNVRRQIESEIAAVKRMRWRAKFGSSHPPSESLWPWPGLRRIPYAAQLCDRPHPARAMF